MPIPISQFIPLSFLNAAIGYENIDSDSLF